MKQTKISAQIVADSKNIQGDRITTMLVTFPRFILAELNTHRMLSKNSSSSRAIPFAKMIKSVRENPFVAIGYQKDHKGMQGIHYFNEDEAIKLNIKWLKARDRVIESALDLASGLLSENEVFNFDKDGNLITIKEDVIGVTKQLVNRLLEPFMWHTVLITATEWENFFSLRCPQYEFTYNIEYNITKSKYFKSWKDLGKELGRGRDDEWFESATILERLSKNKGMAEIHMMALAEAMWDAMNESSPKELKAGEWHIPFEDKIDEFNLKSYIFNNSSTLEHKDFHGIDVTDEKVKISTAMAARTSYTIVGDEKEFSYEKQIELHDRMANQVPFHASPFEHCAKAMSDEEYGSYVKGWYEQPKYSMGHLIEQGSINTNAEGWCRNYKGFIQYREILENRELIDP